MENLSQNMENCCIFLKISGFRLDKNEKTLYHFIMNKKRYLAERPALRRVLYRFRSAFIAA